MIPSVIKAYCINQDNMSMHNHNFIVYMWLPGMKETVDVRILKALSADLVSCPDLPDYAKEGLLVWQTKYTFLTHDA